MTFEKFKKYLDIIKIERQYLIKGKICPRFRIIII